MFQCRHCNRTSDRFNPYAHQCCACDSQNYRRVIVRFFTLWPMEVLHGKFMWGIINQTTAPRYRGQLDAPLPSAFRPRARPRAIVHRAVHGTSGQQFWLFPKLAWNNCILFHPRLNICSEKTCFFLPKWHAKLPIEKKHTMPKLPKLTRINLLSLSLTKPSVQNRLKHVHYRSNIVG